MAAAVEVLGLVQLLIVVAAVTMAQQCNENGFYCVDEHHFQTCPGEGQPPAGNINDCTTLFCSMDCNSSCVEFVPCRPTITTELPTTTEAPTTTMEPPPQYTCQTEGSFPDPDDCRSFYSCVPRDGGGFWTLHLTCPEGSLFDAAEERCSVNATCGGGVPGAGCNRYGFRCVDATHGQLCPDEGLPPQGEVFTCPQGATCQDNCQYVCWADGGGGAVCPTQPPPTTPPPPMVCTAAGRFEVPEDCSAYYVCVLREDATFALLRLTCPSGSGFDATSGRCSEAVPCRRCNAYGFACVDATHVQACDAGADVPDAGAAVTECPAGTRCRAECQLECWSDADAACPTLPPPTTAPPDEECVNVGRFANPEDCSRYFVCSPQGGSGGSPERLVRVDFTCPPGTAFDEASQRCGQNVTCGGVCNPQGFYCVDSTHVRLCERGESRPAPGAATVTCDPGTTCDMECMYECWGGTERCPPSYKCQQEGRFPAPHNCTYFYVCSKKTSSNDFFQLLVPCPDGSRYDVATTKCSENATCAAPLYVY